MGCIMKIIDISHHDTGQDLTKHDGVIIKATEGVGYVDPALEVNVRAAKAAGKPYGLYHYLSFQSNIQEQIAAFRTQLSQLGGTLRPSVDVERDYRINRVVPVDVTKRVCEFMSTFSEAMLYANPDILSYLDANVLGGWPLWLAEYNQKPRDVPGFTRIGWQYRENPDESEFTEAVFLNTPDDTGKSSVLEYQRKLNRLSVPQPPLVEDGILGLKTQTAIRSFEQICGLTVDTGIWGPQCEEAYRRIFNKPTLRQGSTGLIVRYLQYRIGAVIDGIFGPKTCTAVKAFQTRCGITPDGIVGPVTYRCLGVE